MSQKNIKEILRDFGLSNKESHIYVFLAKQGVLKAGEISKGTKTARPLVYRILKNLQKRGLVQITLEAPKRYLAIPFEKALNSFIEHRRKEIESIEKKKNELITDWTNISYPELESQIERFAVIEGNKKIYQKISQMIKETRNQLFAMLTVPTLLRADKFGVYEKALNNSAKSKVKLSFLTEIHDQNLVALKEFLNRIPNMGLNFKVRNPEFGLELSPQMVIKDSEEVIFFITPQNKSQKKSEACLWTNCKALIKAFQGVFMELWKNSTDITLNLGSIATNSPSTKTCIITDEKVAKKKYEEILRSAKRDVIIMTSSKSLANLWKNRSLLEKWFEVGVSAKIMAPIVAENLEIAKQLSKYCVVRHVSKGHVGTSIIDGEKLFQFRYPRPDLEFEEKSIFSNMFYSNEQVFVTKTMKMLNNLWNNAQTPSSFTLNSIIKIPANIVRHDIYKNSVGYVEDPEVGITSEKNILNKIINGKKFPGDNCLKNVIRYYGSSAQAIIHPPDQFKIPDMLVLILHNNKQSSFGAEDVINFYLWLETPKGHSYVPVAVIQDNSDSVEFRRRVYAGTPAAENIQVVRKNELQVRVHGDTLFAGWTVPTELIPKKYNLPPSAILFEGFGEMKTEVIKTELPSGRKQIQERNFFEAFVTFLHPSSKYVGPGTDGLLCRDVVFTSIPPA